MIVAPVETLELRVPAELEAVRGAARNLETHLRLRGLSADAWSSLELAVVEGLNNAAMHGCASCPRTGVVVRATWSGTQLAIEIRDPGKFTPDAAWGKLPDDPLAEHGRGGFLMTQAFARVEHLNDARGHTLVLATELAHAPGDAADAVEAEATAQEMTADLETAYESVAGLRFLASLLAKSTAPGELIERALARLHEIDGFAFAYVRTVRGTQLDFERGEGKLPALPASVSLGDDAMETRAVLTQDTQRIAACDALASIDPLHCAGGPAIVVPICFEHQRVGALVVVRARDREFFSAGTIELTQTVAEFLGVAWATAQLQARQRDLEFTTREATLAAEMQERLLPASFPARADMRFSGTCRSARTAGGDYYDVFSSDGGTLLVIADAMGKGLPAAFVASVLRCAIRAREHLAADPGRLLTAVNRQITGDLLALDIFVTALVGFVPAGGNELRLSSAGHCPAFVRRADGGVESVDGTGVPLGVFAEAEFSTVSVPLAANDVVVFLTDGLYEIGETPDAHLGLERFRAAVATTAGRTADDTLLALMDATEAAAGNGPASDDRTLLVCERLP
jgi:serine phosphatase RsbU (regulator of sigma subunit)/anti-sigma regulatory factor (Ser/Thr protein kinase)